MTLEALIARNELLERRQDANDQRVSTLENRASLADTRITQLDGTQKQTMKVLHEIQTDIKRLLKLGGLGEEADSG